MARLRLRSRTAAGTQAADKRERVRALVNIAKSSDTKREVINQKTFEIQGFRLDRKRCEYVPESDPLSAHSDHMPSQRGGAPWYIRKN